jgi:site-specific DNA-methyltransferase (adenine-specific)
MEYMKGLEDKAFDLAIVDPPYKEETNGLTAGFGRDNFNYTYFKPPTKEMIAEIFRVSKNQIFWGFNYYMNLLPNTDACIFWYKHQNGHFSEGELAWCSFAKTRHFDRAYQKDIGDKIHPTQKPITLYKWILKNYAKPGDKILDTHGGSMSSAIACYQMGFDLTLCEIDKDYYDAGVKRYKKAIAQEDLFEYDGTDFKIKDEIKQTDLFNE